MNKNAIWGKPLFFIPLSILLTALGLFCISLYSPFILATNDDVFRKMIVSGELTGSPSPYMIYGHYALGLLLSGLYSLTRAVPWYGLFCLGLTAASLSVIVYRFFRLPYSLGKRLLVVIPAGFCVLVCLFRQLVISQYTVTAALAGAAAVFWAMTFDLRGSHRSFLLNLTGISLLALCSYLMRDDSFYMLLPFAAVLWLCRWAGEKRRMEKQTLLRFLSLPAALAAAVFLLFCVQKLAYASGDWAEFTRYNKNREIIFDYYGFPEYEANRELYEGLGITEESLNAISTRYMTLLDSSYNGESMELLAEAAERQNKPPFDGAYLRKMMEDWRTLSFGQSEKPLNYGVLFGYLILLAGVLLTRDKSTGLSLGGLFAARTLTWLYLLYGGRYPQRVTQALFLAEFVILLSLLWLLAEKHRNSRPFSWFLVLSLFLCCGAAVSFGRTGVPQAKGSAVGQAQFSEAYQELKDYCTDRPENFYFLDVYTVAFYIEPMLKTAPEGTPNYLALGSWASTSPLSRSLLAANGIEDPGAAVVEDPGVRMIFLKDSVLSGEYLFSYYRAAYPGARFTLTDTWRASNGVTFEVYQGSLR